MADSVRKVQYAYVMVPNRAGQAAKMLLELKNEGVDLVAFSGFPGKKGAQMDLVTHDMTGLKRVARRVCRSGGGAAGGHLRHALGHALERGAELQHDGRVDVHAYRVGHPHPRLERGAPRRALERPVELHGERRAPQGREARVL